LDSSKPSAHKTPASNPAMTTRHRTVTASANRGRIPARWRGDIGQVLIGRAEIARRIRELSERLEADFGGRDLVVVAVLTGTVMFLADLMRHLSLPLRLDFIGVSSYGQGTESGELVFTKELRLDVRNRDVLLVDDILDTGKTLRRVTDILRSLRPRRLRSCVLLEKSARRVERIEADYVGFRIPDLFVVGYGLDFAERYRNLPFIGVLRPACYQTGRAPA
jgi:hypoxanthine phosphoribosyltransferase